MASPLRTGFTLLERFCFALLVVGTALYGKACGQARPKAAHTIFLYDSLVASLDSLADTAAIEHFRCLLGRQVGDTLLVGRAVEPFIIFADYNGVKAGPCPPFTVGTWHTHIAFAIPMTDPHNRKTPLDPWSVCELSPLDQRTVLREPWTFTMISVANGVHCAWQRNGTRLERVPWGRP